MRWWNVKHPARYAALLAEGESPEADRELLTDAERHTERVMLRLRLATGLPLDLLDGAGAAAAARAAADGLLDPAALAAGPAVLTRRGRLLADRVVHAVAGPGVTDTVARDASTAASTWSASSASPSTVAPSCARAEPTSSDPADADGVGDDRDVGIGEVVAGLERHGVAAARRSGEHEPRRPSMGRDMPMLQRHRHHRHAAGGTSAPSAPHPG